MKLKASINLGDFEHISLTSNHHKGIRECAEELIKELSKVNHYEIDNFLKSFIIPLIFDQSRDIEEFKVKSKKINHLDKMIKSKEELIEDLRERINFLQADYQNLIQKVVK